MVSWRKTLPHLKACPHLFPKQATLLPETATLFPKAAILFPFQATLFPETKIACFGNKCGQALNGTKNRSQSAVGRNRINASFLCTPIANELREEIPLDGIYIGSREKL